MLPYYLSVTAIRKLNLFDLLVRFFVYRLFGDSISLIVRAHFFSIVINQSYYTVLYFFFEYRHICLYSNGEAKPKMVLCVYIW